MDDAVGERVGPPASVSPATGPAGLSLALGVGWEVSVARGVSVVVGEPPAGTAAVAASDAVSAVSVGTAVSIVGGTIPVAASDEVSDTSASVGYRVSTGEMSVGISVASGT
jgi:hypothetical protein